MKAMLWRIGLKVASLAVLIAAAVLVARSDFVWTAKLLLLWILCAAAATVILARWRLKGNSHS